MGGGSYGSAVSTKIPNPLFGLLVVDELLIKLHKKGLLKRNKENTRVYRWHDHNN